MLRFLSVRHLAVIDHLEVEFEPGLNVLTGETGAGKSILVEAIDLLRRRPRQRRPRAHRRGARDHAGHLRARGRPRDDRPPRSLGAGPQPRVHRRHARDHGGAARTRRGPARSARPARTSGAARSGRAPRSARRLRGSAGRGLAASPRDSTRGGAPRRRASARRLDEREKRARIEIASLQLQEIDNVAPATARTSGSPPSDRARQRRPAQPARDRGVRGALRGRRRRARRARPSSGSASPTSRRSTRASRRTSSSVTRSSRGSRTSRSFCAATARISTRRPSACRPSRIGSRRSSA